MAETTKKAKAPAKPRAAAGTAKAESAEKTDATVKKATAKKTTESAKVAAVTPSHEEIAQLAQQYWAERGHQDGHAEQDWLRAEQELMKLAS